MKGLFHVRNKILGNGNKVKESMVLEILRTTTTLVRSHSSGAP